MLIRYVLALSFVLSGLTEIVGQTPCKEVVGYYPNWQWYDRSKLVRPATIDYSKYTVINYAFFNPQLNGTISLTDAWADENLLLGPMNWQINEPDVTQSLPYLCHQNGVKILASIGGWTLSNNFPTIAASPLGRETFAQSCVALIDTYDFDGVDIDWEYPGYAPHNGTEADESNYILMLQEIRAELDARELETGETYMLTAALPAGPSNMANIDWPGVSAVLDFMNIMTYDFFGAFDTHCNHNSPLYAPAQGDPQFNCAAAMQTLMNELDMDPSKLVMGVPFYGRSAKTMGAPALFAPIQNNAADNATFWADEGTPLYYNVLLNKHLFTEHWDNQAQTPYLTGNNGLDTFVSFDDTTSVSLKASFINLFNLRGAIIWEITGDYLETAPGSGIISETPLANRLNEVFCEGFVPVIPGCMNPEAMNYNVLANEEDGSCILHGCMYPSALNYNPQATIDDLSCIFEAAAGCAADINGDGSVNVADLLIFTSEYGSACE
jgi:chitinase